MIGIIGAMEEEVAELKKDMQIEETVEMAGMVFCKGTLGGKDVVIVRSGIGKVNAGICAQILVSQFGADTLINTGIAGSLMHRLILATWSFPRMHCIMIWMRLYSVIRQDRFREWIHCHSRQIRNL